MEVFVSILYTQRFSRPFLGLFGKKRQHLELVGISIDSGRSGWTRFNKDYRIRGVDQYSDPGVFTMIPNPASLEWWSYAEIVEMVDMMLGTAVGEPLTIITNGDPHQESLMAKLIAETGRDFDASYRSLEQLIEDAARWLPVEHYGSLGNFMKRRALKDGEEYDQDDRIMMFTSHRNYPVVGRNVYLIDRVIQLKAQYDAINSIMVEELNNPVSRKLDEWS